MSATTPFSRILSLFAAVAMMAVTPAWALSGSAEVTVTKALMQNCITQMKANQQGSGYTDDKIHGFCSCMGTKTARELEDSEVSLYVKSGGKGTVHMRDMNSRISRECGKRYLK